MLTGVLVEQLARVHSDRSVGSIFFHIPLQSSTLNALATDSRIPASSHFGK